MANYLDANSDERLMVEHHRHDGSGMIPVAADGMLDAMVSARCINGYALSSPLPVADYVVGLKLLGNRFSVFRDSRGHQRVGVILPVDERPASWARHERAIEAAFGIHSSRADELVEFLLERDGEAL
ncbi:hypothetical protein D3218_01650 [Aureimonas flava]|uniref:Uncharacterized protein n=1 Tax=Aureimonas flava TaxID=2320271 RepID=A0A3A1WQ18_9HYPH|nr:hypothetical protein [Aureimonas flava]RIY03490.1 hypothetical protein D3218_01650 [Aureimonas flava]